ncbi:MAG: hypothetical protein JXR73_19360 [Candidatus Omnitrophica bacterium]|nr:hypothetical protein [Candidatus Omnitrophota bacterium]
MNGKKCIRYGFVYIFPILLFQFLNNSNLIFANDDEHFTDAIESDWQMQELRFNRSPEDPETIREVFLRGRRLIKDLLEMKEPPDLTRELEDHRKFEDKVNDLDSIDANGRLSLYREIRWLNRSIALKNPLFASTKLAFLQRKRFICQMLHEYLGYYYDYADIEGGGVFLLEHPGTSFHVRDLTAGRLPRGNYTTLSLSFDAQTLYFAFSERAEQKPDYYSSDRKGFHIYAVNSDGSDLRALTGGQYDDFDPCELPNGDIVFMSTRRGGFGRCHNPWEPLPTYTLHRMKPGGSNIHTLSFHETNEWHPSILPDGRIVYTRWDYVDRSAANFHGLWSCNPDGSNPMSLFGNYTMRINACYQPRAIPGSDRIIFVAGAHHADVGGSLVILDPKQAALDSQNGEDDFSSLEFLTPEVCFPEAPGWPQSYFHSPWPLSENYFLTAFSFDPLPGMGPHVDKDTTTGVYLLDRFGNMELLYREDGLSSMYPIPLRPRSVPPSLPSNLNPDLGMEGEFLLSNLYQSHFPMSSSRPISSLHIFQILPKSETHVANQPRLGYANAESARMLLGSVPVEQDGSAYFRAPARVPLAFQAIDGKGKAVQGMRSLTYLQPGERRGCIGCHEPIGRASGLQPTMAFQRKPSKIKPGPDGTLPWSYPRLMQPILDRHCIGCHDGAHEDRPDLTSKTVGTFTASYENLKPYVRWYEWGNQSITPIVTHPGRMPSDVSPLLEILKNENHAKNLSLNDDEWRRIYLWLDGNASFYGCYSKQEQLAQLQGDAIPPPELQ